MDQEILAARAKLAAKFGNPTQLGGKGTQRRKHKHVNSQQQAGEDKKLKSAIKKFGVQQLSDIDEVNMFKDDNTVLHFRKPHIQFSVRENLLVVTGNSETKQLKDMLPEILKQVGPQQYGYLKDMMGDLGKAAGVTAGDEDEDDVPPLVQGTFEDAAKH